MSITFDPPLNRTERRRRAATAKRKKQPPQLYDPGASPFKGATLVTLPNFARRHIRRKK